MKNTIILLFAKIFDKGVMFLFYSLLARELGRSVFGEFSYHLTITTISFMLFNLGGDFYQIREFSKKESLKIFNSIFLIKVALFFLTLIIVNNFFTNNIYFNILLVSYFFESIISIFRSSMYKNSYYVLEAKYTIIEKVFFISLIVINLFTVQNLLLVYLAFIFSKCVYVLFLSKKFYNFKYLLRLKKLFDLNFSKNYLLGSWSYIIHSLLVVIFVQIDVIMLKILGISYADIGLYSAAIKIYMLAIIFADVLFKQYYPIISKLVYRNDKRGLKKIVHKIQKTNIFFSAYFAALMMMFSNEIMSIAFGKEFIEASKMLTILSLVIVFRFSMYTYTALLSSSNLNYIKIFTSLTCVIVNITLNFMLIPKFGIYGSIIATVVTEFLLVILYKYSSFKIVFVNLISWQEASLLLFSVSFLMIMLLYVFRLEYKLVVLGLLIVSVIINYKNIKQMLIFERID